MSLNGTSHIGCDEQIYSAPPLKADLVATCQNCRDGQIAEVTFRINIKPRSENTNRRLLAGGADPGPSPAGNCEYHFLDLCLGKIFDPFQLNVREVGQFIGWNHAVDYRWTFRLERFFDGLA